MGMAMHQLTFQLVATCYSDIEKKSFAMHGGIEKSINHVQQIEALQYPITMEASFIVLNNHYF
jgi:hypothetical protein